VFSYRFRGSCRNPDEVHGTLMARRQFPIHFSVEAPPHPEHLQEQQQGENRVKSMLFHMSGEGALLTICSKRRSPPGADVPGEWICCHRAQPNSSHIPPSHGHLGAAVAFGRGPLAGKHYQPRQLALDFCCC
jgi:hypothetical protein